ncbi:hypothetical protein AURDEDRAFT_116701 [Auricularia subglabra TFB-10046 SS5]|uniref:Uncharacterized protein n=1 Tax=Auricularia subglabra (strain TFB-10046 / SS5) TaxID=717982 RepID=J0DB46_AURST|nr:hypothetical protein AURDEDRAFT_116701 [Auricularia subglabra TFB-10046 SS5]
MLYGASYLRLATPLRAAHHLRRAFAGRAQAQNAALPAAPSAAQPPVRPVKSSDSIPGAKKAAKLAAQAAQAQSLETAIRLYVHAWRCGVPVRHHTARVIINQLLQQRGDKLVPVRSLLLALSIVLQQARHPDGPDITMDCHPLVAAIASQTAMPDRSAHIRELLDRVGQKTLCLDVPHSRSWRLLRKVYTRASHAEAIEHLITREAITLRDTRYVFKLVSRIRFDSSPTMSLEVLLRYLAHLRRNRELRPAIPSVMVDYLDALSAQIGPKNGPPPDATVIEAVYQTLRTTERAVERQYKDLVGQKYHDSVRRLYSKISEAKVDVHPAISKRSR